MSFVEEEKMDLLETSNRVLIEASWTSLAW